MISKLINGKKDEEIKKITEIGVYYVRDKRLDTMSPTFEAVNDEDAKRRWRMSVMGGQMPSYLILDMELRKMAVIDKVGHQMVIDYQSVMDGKDLLDLIILEGKEKGGSNEG